MTPAPLWQSLVAGTAGGVCNTLVGHPLDTVKVRLQTGQKKGLWKGLYSGVGSRMAGVIPDWIACYIGYSFGKRIEYPKWVTCDMKSFSAGCIAGFLGGLVLTPFDSVKIHAQNHNVSTLKAVRQLGPRGLFRGFCATMVWSVPSQAVFFLAFDVGLRECQNYEKRRQRDLSGSAAKAAAKKDAGAIAGAASSSGAPPAFNGGLSHWDGGALASALGSALPPAFWCPLMAGGLAGGAEWLVTLPLDTVKTRVQAGESAGFLSGTRDVVRAYGLRGLFKGFVPTMLRAFPCSAAAFGGIALVEEWFDRHDKRSLNPTGAGKSPDPFATHQASSAMVFAPPPQQSHQQPGQQPGQGAATGGDPGTGAAVAEVCGLGERSVSGGGPGGVDLGDPVALSKRRTSISVR